MPESAGKKPVETIGDAIEQSTNVKSAPPPTRRHRAVIFQVMLFSAVAVFTLLAFLVETIPSFPLDLKITRAIQTFDSPFFSQAMRFISWPGFLPQSVVITLLIALVLFLYRLRWESVIALLATFLSGALNELIKTLIQRPRPGMDMVDVFAVLKSYSFPSGHVMFYTSLFGFIWYLAYTLPQRSWQRSLLLVLFGGLVLSVGVSRIYLGQHWASDVLGAYIAGGLILVGIVVLHQWGKKRFFVQQSADHPSSGKE